MHGGVQRGADGDTAQLRVKLRIEAPPLGEWRGEAAMSWRYTLWPLQDISIVNIVWCVLQKRGVGGKQYIAQSCGR